MATAVVASQVRDIEVDGLVSGRGMTFETAPLQDSQCSSNDEVVGVFEFEGSPNNSGCLVSIDPKVFPPSLSPSLSLSISLSLSL